MTKQIDVAVLPSEIEALPADCYVVVDVLRATTTIATLFENGLTDLIVTGDLALAREVAARDSRILCGEVHGLPPEGFDFGNSPCEARDANVAGRGAVLYTTNGTPTLCAVAQKGVCFAGALANISAVAQAVAGYEHVVIEDKGEVFNSDLTQALELGFMLELAECMVVCGIARKESRGAHARPYDFPDRDDENFLKHTIVTWKDGKPALDWRPVTMTKWTPKERTY